MIDLRSAYTSFEPTAAVLAGRGNRRFVDCPVCASADHVHLFHRRGTRFVRCRSCEAVFATPIPTERDAALELELGRDKLELARREIDGLFARLEDLAERSTGQPLRRAVWIGSRFDGLASTTHAVTHGLRIVDSDDSALLDGRLGETEADLTGADLVVVNELLDLCSHPTKLLRAISDVAAPGAFIAVVNADALSFPLRQLRRYWPRWTEPQRVSYFDADQLRDVLTRSGLEPVISFDLPARQNLVTAWSRLFPQRELPPIGPLRALSVSVPVGRHVAVARTERRSERQEKLSIIVPVYNEAEYVEHLLGALRAKPVPIDREIIVVESGSTDGSRDIVERLDGVDGIRVIFEDAPRGKGHAVRTGLGEITGTIVLIQDADFEYDLDDYEALLRPLLDHRTSFVLGSRSAGLDDWKVRQYPGNPIKGFAMNFAQVVFARTFNLLFRQKTTDINTMFKVFRSECLDGVDLRSNGFELDIELVCKLVANAHEPIEVPVNYRSRSFAEGKKIRFFHDAYHSYLMLFRCRFDKSFH